VSQRPSLSVCGITRDSASRLKWWVSRAYEYADEVVLLVDEASSDDTVEVARAYADRVQVVEHPPFIEVAMLHAMQQATSDWVLWLDDDEVMSDAFATSVPQLVADRGFTHYWLPYRWLVQGEQHDWGWLAQFPWHPNPRLRMVRNLSGLYSHRGRLHSPFDVAGDGRILEEQEGVVHHLDLVWRDRAAREAKVAGYRGHNAPSCEEYYFYEDYQPLVVSPLDEDVLRAPTAAGAEAAGARAARHARSSTSASTQIVPSAIEMRRALDQYWMNAPLYGAEYSGGLLPEPVRANRGATARLSIRNTSNVPWRVSGPESGTVVLGYHWVHPQAGLLLRDGDRTRLPSTVLPGQTVELFAGVWTPYEPGHYLLQWDLRSENVNWFSQRGVPPLEVGVDVVEAGRVLSTPRDVARLPPRVLGAQGNETGTVQSEPRRRHGRPAAAQRALGSLVRQAGVAPARVLDVPAPVMPPGVNVIAIKPVRALDTRDGTGAPGAAAGALAAGATLTLDVLSLPRVPASAVGLIATLSALDGTYNGFLTAFAADGTAGEAFVSVYIADGGPPTTNQVTIGLGTGMHAGGVSIHASDNSSGTVHVLLDLVAYLA